VLGVRRYLVVDYGGTGRAEGFEADPLAELIEAVSHGRDRATRPS
jgi:hypothetical protein